MKKSLTLRQVQLLECDLLEAFADFCLRHELRWSVNGGTLLGAVRHRGFIPWDDDVDLDMPRPDYDRMLALAADDPLLPAHIDVRAPVPFCKWLDSRTLIRRKNVVPSPEESRVWIDIFPLDGLPEEDAARRRLYRAQSVRCRALSLLQSRNLTGSPVRRAGRAILRPLVRLEGREALLQKLDRTARRIPYDASPLVGNVCWGAGWDQEVRRRDSWYEGRRLPFEHLLVRAPSPEVCRRYLTQRYGNYMELPPEGQRTAHEMEAWIEL